MEINAEGLGELFGGLALGLGILAFVAIIGFVFTVLTIVGTWKVFSKMGEPGWKSIIPIYNSYVLCAHTWNSGWLFLLWLIPVVGQIAMLATYWKLFAGFGKGFFFCLLGLLFQPICLLICAFDQSVYSPQNF